MVLFRYLISLLLSLSLLQAQPVSVMMKSEAGVESHVVSVADLEAFLQQQLELQRDQGYLEARLEIDSLSSSDTLRVVLKRGTQVVLSQIHFPRMGLRWEDYYRRELLLGQTDIDFQDLTQAEQHLRVLGLSNLSRRTISRDATGLYHVSYLEIRQPELNIDAMATFNQASNSDTLTWFGNLNVIIPNLGGSGKRIELFWKRLRSNSEIFSLYYRHPQLLARALAGEIRFRREVVDGQYQTVNRYVGLDYRFDWDQKVSVMFERQLTLLTREGTELNQDWLAGSHRSFGVGYYFSSIDPARGGFALRSNLWQELNFEPSSVSRLELRTELKRPLIGAVALSQRSVMVAQTHVNANDPGARLALGGEATVRGYEEGYVRSSSILALQHDLEWQLGPRSKLFGVFDLGFYPAGEEIRQMTGYGIGFQLRSSTDSPLRLIVASHAGLGFRQSFIHIEYIGIRKWIDRS